MYIDNGWYGGRYILSKYCKTKEYTAFTSIQHGHNVVNEKNLVKRKISMTPWLVRNNKISKKCHQNNIVNVIPIGSIFIYLEKIYKVKIKNPKISIILPTYNRSKMLKSRSISSVLNQSYKNFEIIIISDGSTDETNKIVKSFNDKRIKYKRIKCTKKYKVTLENHWFARPVNAISTDFLKTKYISIAKI